jgi:hypothetical protein
MAMRAWCSSHAHNHEHGNLLADNGYNELHANEYLDFEDKNKKECLMIACSAPPCAS